MTAAGGLQRPALDSMVPRLVPREELPAAAALEAFRVNAGQIAGPAVGGLLIAGPGLTATYAVDAATFLVSLVALARGCRPGDPSRPRRRGERRHRRAIVGFGLAGPLPLALALLAIAGAADMSSGIFRSTMWNQTIPDSLRGRLAGIEQLSYSIGPTLGTTQSGTVASIACAPRPSAAACCAWRGRSCCAR